MKHKELSLYLNKMYTCRFSPGNKNSCQTGVADADGGSGEGRGTAQSSIFRPFPTFRSFSGRTDLTRPLLRKKSVPNPPFSWRLLPPCLLTKGRKIFTQLFGEFQGAVFPVPKISLDARTFTILKVLISREVL